MKFMLAPLVLAVVFVLCSWQAFESRAREQARRTSGEAKVIELYEVRLEEAKTDLRADEVQAAFLAERAATFTDADPARACSDAKNAVAQAKLDVAASKLAVREAEVQLDLIKMGLADGKVSLDDIRLSTDPRPRRSR